MSRKFIEYEIIPSSETKRVYEDEDPFLYTRVFDFVGDHELPYTLRGGEVRILKVGGDNGD